MSTTTFSVDEVTRWRDRAADARDVPEETPPGWSISLVSPAAVVAVFGHLRIREGYALRAYQFREGGNGNGFVYGVRATSNFLDPADCPRDASRLLEPPQPPDALPDFMEAIAGERVATAYHDL